MITIFKNILAAIILFLPLLSVGQNKAEMYLDPSNSISDRVDNLIAQMTLEEKVSQLMYDSPAIPRLDIPKYNWWNECLHGVARNGKATVFPQAIGMASTFDTDMMHRIGEAIAIEGRAKYNMNQKLGYREQYAGLTYWSPNVNLFRDPRWGRGQETYGEDPYLISRLGVSFVNGLQGQGDILKVAAMAKHFAVHSGPEKLRHTFDAVVSRHDLWNTYLPAFEALVKEANVEGVMGAYNRTNGELCCAHPYLMKEVLRDKWNFQGYFVSDCWAIQDFYQGHKTDPDKKSAAATALNAGCNLNCGNTYPELLKSIDAGLTDEDIVDENLKQLLATRFKLGMFDKGQSDLDQINIDNVRTEKHIDLAHEAAVKSMVLLKNENDLLPLDTNISSLFVTGPTAANVQALLANYYGVSDDLKTLLEGISAKVSNHTAIRYVQGNLLDRPNVNPMDWYSEEAAIAEVTVACMGITQLLEGEEGEAIASATFGDREYITLPPHQIEYLKKLRAKAKKLVVVITAGSAISIPEVHDMADAIIYAWYPGEQGGQALGDILFGDYSPSGKLPVTFVKTLDDLPPYENYEMKGRTYRYMDTEPLYPFGFGLSYADIEIASATADRDVLKSGKNIHLDIRVDNKSNMNSDEVVQVYVAKKNKKTLDPNMSLKAFKRIMVKANSSTDLKIVLDDKVFSMYDDEGNLFLNKGKYELHIATSLPIQRSLDLGASQWKTINITVK